MCVDETSNPGDLEAELDALNRRKAELEVRLGRRAPPVRREDRRRMDAQIEFIADFDIVQAKGIDLSEGGICFEVREELPFEMRFEIGEKEYRKRARLVWLERLQEGGYRLGFEFIPRQEDDL